MPPSSIEKSNLSLAIETLLRSSGDGDSNEEAALLAEAALVESQDPPEEMASAFVAGVARLYQCHDEESLGACSLADDYFAISQELGLLCRPAEDCAALKNEAQIWGESAQIVSDRLAQKLGEAIEKLDRVAVAYQPTNCRLPAIEIKKSEILRGLNQFTPPVDGTHRTSLSVYNEFDLASGEWIATVGDLYPYHERARREHTFEGRLRPSSFFSAIYSPPRALITLPVPDDFLIDSKSVEIDGSRNGFDLLRSGDGILYARMREGSFGLHRVRFEMGPGRLAKSSAIPPATQNDLLGDVPLADAVHALFDRTRFMGAREIYAETNRLVEEMIGYPTDGDIISGRAIFEAGDAKEFFSKIWEMELADCDVANSLGVALLRRQGVPARLVTGYLMQNGGMGYHGWLEFFDDHLKEWVPADMTSPMRANEKEMGNEKEAGNGIVRSSAQQYLQASHPLRMTKQEDKVDEYDPFSPPVDRFWAFRGKEMIVSQPSGRYVVAKPRYRYEDGKKTDVYQPWEAYDLEKNIFVNLPALSIFLKSSSSPSPERCISGLSEEVKAEAYETSRGLAVVFECHELGNPGYRYSWSFGEPDDYFVYGIGGVSGHLLVFPETGKIRILQLPNEQTSQIVSQAEDAEGNLNVLIRNDLRLRDKVEYYFVAIDPKAEIGIGGEVFIKGADALLGDPLITVWKDVDVATSPDGSHTALFYKKDGNNPAALELKVFEGRNEKYNLWFDTHELPEIKLDNDGSAVIRQSGPNLIQTTNLDSQGRHQYEKDRLWRVKQVKDGTLLVLNGFDAKGKEQEIDRMLAGLIQQGDFLKKISWDGSWAASEQNLYQYDPAIKRFVTTFGENVPFCSDRHGEIVCLSPGPATVDTMQVQNEPYFDPEFSFPQGMDDGRAWIFHELRPTLHEMGETVFWEGGIEAVSGFRSSVLNREILESEPRAGVVHRREDAAAYTLRETLKEYEEKRLSPPTGDLRLLLGEIAKRPREHVFYEWPLIGAAKLFESEEFCLSSESSECGFERTAAQQFRAEYGAALADRFTPHLRESMRFPNRNTIVESWAQHLLSRPILLEKMAAENPSLAAEAVFKIVEKGMLDPRKFPKMSLEEEAKLTAALKILLTHHRNQLYRALERSRPAMWTPRLEVYQHFTQTLARRFSRNILPGGGASDW